jgi:sn-glycerol 3-phosphate transport system permease protein
MRRDWPAILLSLPFLGPIAFLFLASFTPSREFGQGRYWSFPPTLESFSQAWQSATFILYYRNTILYTVGLLAVQLVTVTLAGYALARLRFPGRQGVFYVVLLQLFLPPVVLILPNFLTLRAIGLGDTLTGLAMPYVASAYGIFLVRQGFRSIPLEYDEAAMLDGAGRVRTLWHVLIPMVRPHLAAFSVVSLIYHWNEFLWPLVATSSNSNRVLAVGLQSFTRASESGAEWGLICAGTLIVIAPLMLLFVLFQRLFIESFTQSGLKG